jgi:hypothetical protein
MSPAGSPRLGLLFSKRLLSEEDYLADDISASQRRYENATTEMVIASFRQ